MIGRKAITGTFEPVVHDDRVERPAGQPVDVGVAGGQRSDVVRGDVTEGVAGGEVPARPVASRLVREPLEGGHEGEAADQEVRPAADSATVVQNWRRSRVPPTARRRPG